jgi:hypothetical protein
MRTNPPLKPHVSYVHTGGSGVAAIRRPPSSRERSSLNVQRETDKVWAKQSPSFHGEVAADLDVAGRHGSGATRIDADLSIKRGERI